MSFWEDIPLGFIIEAKKRGLKVYSLLPEVLTKKENYKCLSDNLGRSFNQPCFSESERWSDNNIKRLNLDLVDEYIITDMKWYLMVECEKGFLFSRTPPYHSDGSKKILESFGLEIPKIFNFEKNKDIWIRDYQKPLFDIYFKRFYPILDFLKSKNNKYTLPITVRNEVSDNLCNHTCVPYYKEVIDKYECNVMLLNASKQINMIKSLDPERKYEVLGGTEDATGLVDHKNGRKLINNGYNGTITNEHQILNNRHPTWGQIKAELKYLKEMKNEH